MMFGMLQRKLCVYFSTQIDYKPIAEESLLYTDMASIHHDRQAQKRMEIRHFHSLI